MQDCFYFNFRKGWHAWVFRSLNASQEPLWARNMRALRLQTPVHWPTPLWSFAKFRGRPSFATHPIGFEAHGARPHIHTAVTVGGRYCHSVCDGFHVFLVLGQYFRIVVIMRLRILATIAIDPLFEIKRTKVAINSCTSPRSHIGTSSVPPPHHHGRGPCRCKFSFGVKSPYHIQQDCSLSPGPLWVHPTRGTRPRTGCCGSLGANSSLVRRHAKPLYVYSAPRHRQYLGRLTLEACVLLAVLLFCLGVFRLSSLSWFSSYESPGSLFRTAFVEWNPQVGPIPKLHTPPRISSIRGGRALGARFSYWL